LPEREQARGRQRELLAQADLISIPANRRAKRLSEARTQICRSLEEPAQVQARRLELLVIQDNPSRNYKVRKAERARVALAPLPGWPVAPRVGAGDNILVNIPPELDKEL
jgi:hypothetical protein